MKDRYIFLDLLRAYAVIMMIQGHTLSAVLVPEAKMTSLYQFLHILRGLTAPAFLIASGCALAFSMFRKKNLAWWNALFHRFTRITPILLMGYFLHLPRFSFYQLLTQATDKEVAQFFQCDILQTIGWTIIILQIVFIFLPMKKMIIPVSLVGMLLILFFTPQINNSVITPNFLTQLLTPKFGSNFPLFPFSAYLIFGFLFGYVFHRAQEYVDVKVIALPVFVSGVIFFGASFVVKILDFALFYQRTGLLLVLISLFLMLERKKSNVLNFFAVIGQESLLIYFFHLIIIYGSVLNRVHNFVYYFGNCSNTFIGVVLAIALIIFMLGIAYLWHYFKLKNSSAAQVLRNSFFALIATKFFTTL
ncbi:MAG: heparan-alpha-glucosaminide N-acetyltransferase domain-containing protein [bacterium]